MKNQILAIGLCMIFLLVIFSGCTSDEDSDYKKGYKKGFDEGKHHGDNDLPYKNYPNRMKSEDFQKGYSDGYDDGYNGKESKY
jgi:hypothetical protein